MTQDRLEIIAEGEAERGQSLFLSNDLKLYIRNPKIPFMQSPALSLRFNEKEKFIPYQESLTPKSALSLLWSLDDESSSAYDVLQEFVATAPRLHIVAHFRTLDYVDYFLDDSFKTFTLAPYSRGPFWPANNPSFFNLQEYFQPTKDVTAQAFIGHFLPKKKQFEEQLLEKNRQLEALLASFASLEQASSVSANHPFALSSLYATSVYDTLDTKESVMPVLQKYRTRTPFLPKQPSFSEKNSFPSPFFLKPTEQYSVPLKKPSYYRRICA